MRILSVPKCPGIAAWSHCGHSMDVCMVKEDIITRAAKIICFDSKCTRCVFDYANMCCSRFPERHKIAKKHWFQNGEGPALRFWDKHYSWTIRSNLATFIPASRWISASAIFFADIVNFVVVGLDCWPFKAAAAQPECSHKFAGCPWRKLWLKFCKGTATWQL